MDKITCFKVIYIHMSMHLSDYSMYNVDFFSFAAVLTVSNWRSSSDIVLITRKDHWKDHIYICIHVHANLDCVPIFVCLLLLLLCWRCMHLWIKVMLVHVFNVHSLIHIFCIHRAMCVIWVTNVCKFEYSNENKQHLFVLWL